ncbi:MAG TPA: ZIP family metal transporter [Steroidobacteraceae bacterium]|nr:ZIP family metal transporter [Steroidobacteraceae bacterium]
MNTLIWIVSSTLVSGVLSVLAAGLFLALPGRQREAALPHLVSFATGALLGAALLALIPHAVIGAGSERVHEVGIALIAGIALFFVLEKFLLWRHCHDDHCDTHTVGGHLHHHDHGHATPAHHHNPGTEDARRKASGALVLVGDALHNVLDGVLIAAAFLTDVHLGLVTAVAIMAHEIPQEVGNFAVLLHSGMSRSRALLLNMLTSLTAVIGGVAGFFALEQTMAVLPFALAVAASSLLYVAVADLIPGLHRRIDPRSSVMQVLLISLGVAVITFAERHAH